MRLGKGAILACGRVPLPTVPGTPYGGGYYVGRMAPGDGNSYALILSPKALGQSTLALKTSNTTTEGTNSTWSGAANTSAMIVSGAAAHPAASFCKNLTIGGFTDWVLPAKDQLEMCYRVFKPGTTSNNTDSGANPSSSPTAANYTAGSPAQSSVAVFKTGGSEAFDLSEYWSSTQVSANGDTVQIFTNGQQFPELKNTSQRVRAVRMVKI